MSNDGRIQLSVLLAAGGGTRMGTPKGLLRLNDMPLVVAHIRALQTVSVHVCVVIGAERLAHRAVLPPDVWIVENPDWEHTMPADSLRLALRTLKPVGPVLVTPVDTPVAAPEVLAALLRAPAPAVPHSPDGTPGHPVLISAQQALQIRQQAPDGGLRMLLQSAQPVPVESDVHRNFNDPQAWEAYLASG